MAVGVIAFVAAVTGDCIGWVIGRHGGRRLLARLGRFVLLPRQRVAKAETFFIRHGGKIVPLARFFESASQFRWLRALRPGWAAFASRRAPTSCSGKRSDL